MRSVLQYLVRSKNAYIARVVDIVGFQSVAVPLVPAVVCRGLMLDTPLSGRLGHGRKHRNEDSQYESVTVIHYFPRLRNFILQDTQILL